MTQEVMAPERWKQVEQLYHAALALEAEKRAAFLVHAAEGDDELRREVESLLAQDGSYIGILDRPAWERTRDFVAPGTQIQMEASPKRLCPACRAAVSRNQRFCSACGVLLGAPVEAATISYAARSSSDVVNEARFPPGAVLGKRYRIVNILGRGGMGEVYRADDLLLRQPIALKFLPPGATSSEHALGRLRNEVRVAREVSHPNVCRVYDIGEADGLTFLTMEYVDGEDLARLLRRIGKLPRDKALDVARKLCAGLAAAHDKGVIHRDLKPANVMLDAKGQVRITDFGLAVVAEQVRDIQSGTPAYMSPEQRTGKEVTVQSDIYSWE